MKVPGFLLRRLYVKGSLSSTVDGFQFQLRNRLGSGYARGMLPVTLDGQEIDLSATTFEVNGEHHTFEEVSQETPFTLGYNKTTTIRVKGLGLDPSPHKLGMRFEVAGLGEMGFDFTDIPSHDGA
jgi:hypothetical protein